jgi:hypothetical protein
LIVPSDSRNEKRRIYLVNLTFFDSPRADSPFLVGRSQRQRIKGLGVGKAEVCHLIALFKKLFGNIKIPNGGSSAIIYPELFEDMS